MTDDWSLGNFFRGHCFDRSGVGVVKCNIKVASKEQEVSNRESVTGEESRTFTPFLELLSDCVVERIECLCGAGFILLRIVFRVLVPAFDKTTVTEVLRLFEKPVDEIGLLFVVLWVEAVL